MAAAAVGCLAAAAHGGPPQERVDYLRDVQPILKASCYPCHGVERQEGGLRLDLKANAFKGGVSGPAIVAGNSDASPLIARVTGRGGKPTMPLGFAPLTSRQISLLRQWIDQGARWPEGAGLAKHWAYVRPALSPLPTVHNAVWARNPIDRFILARLEKAGLKPSPQAPASTLLRRVYFDLTGLPPTPAEVDAFLNDRRSNAYEAVVDRLLASPAYGERLARPWLDLARYADTNGYEKDGRRSIWPYRDWVINAFNRDMPYDEFTIEQLAGDLLPHSTLDQKIATGFHRNTMLNQEGGVDQEEQRWLTEVDRVGTTGSVFLGTTLACTQCHNHKYDPFTQKEFYKVLAYFDHTDEPDLDVPPAAVAAKYAELKSEIGREEAASSSKDATIATAAKAKLADLNKQLDALSMPTTMVMTEKTDGKIPATCVRVKGAFLTKAELVQAGTPAVLNALPANSPPNRLGLARWIVDRSNPLTARVEVNRLWEMVFGRGIVETSEDFGTQGARPTHPELLDWLAVKFITPVSAQDPYACGWSIKRILRLMVTSAAYRQSSQTTPELIERDPFNRLLARGPRFRLEAETIRDMALDAAGLLSHKVGGPSVFPLQPDGIWNMPYNGDQWVTSKGEDRYRRGLYTFWRRTSPYPEFMSFDATSRESCTVRRIRTDTPLQALTTLNDPAFFEAARGLAARMTKEGGADPRIQIAFGFRCCTARYPRSDELARMLRLYNQEIQRYQANPALAQKIISNDAGARPADAALAVIANVLLNLDETLTKE
jgi:hypothetical protein